MNYRSSGQEGGQRDGLIGAGERVRRARFALTFLFFLLAFASALLLWPESSRAAPGGGTVIYLPMAKGAPANPCEVPDGDYGTLSVEGEPTDRPAAEHPDLNLTIRGWQPSDGRLALIDYGPGMDSKAPQLDALFADRRLPAFTSGWDVYGWDWEAMEPVDMWRPWDITLLGLAVTPGEVIHAPDGGYDIGLGYEALLLYASPNQLTLKYTRDDNVIGGYTVHVEQICVEPDLLALYEQANAAGRGLLPALRGGQPLGRALGAEILVAIRDSGSFMDPRADDDWWKAH